MPSQLFRSIVAATPLLAVSSCGHAPSLREWTAEDSYAAIARESHSTVTICELHGIGASQFLQYVGPTDEGLFACLLKHADIATRTLSITSSGGPVEWGIVSGLWIYQNGWSVEVAGKCVSSCANYLAPAAASLTVLPYSAILSHGGPAASPSADAIRSTVASQTGLEGAALEALVQDTIQRAQRVREMHEEYYRQLRVDPFWAEPNEEVRRAVAIAAEGKAALWVLSYRALKACVHRNVPTQFWYPSTDDEWEQVRQLSLSAIVEIDETAWSTCR